MTDISGCREIESVVTRTRISLGRNWLITTNIYRYRKYIGRWTWFEMCNITWSIHHSTITSLLPGHLPPITITSQTRHILHGKHERENFTESIKMRMKPHVQPHERMLNQSWTNPKCKQSTKRLYWIWVIHIIMGVTKEICSKQVVRLVQDSFRIGSDLNNHIGAGVHS